MANSWRSVDFLLARVTGLAARFSQLNDELPVRPYRPYVIGRLAAFAVLAAVATTILLWDSAAVASADTPSPTLSPTPTFSPTPTPLVVPFTVHISTAGTPFSVSVTLTCTSGTVTPGTQMASDSSPATWLVSDFVGLPTCNATEGPIPPPYQSLGNCMATLAVGQCTIVNFQETSAPSPPVTPPPTPTVCGSCFPPPTGAVGGVADVITTDSRDGSTPVLLGGLLAIAMAGAAVFGYRRATRR